MTPDIVFLAALTTFHKFGARRLAKLKNKFTCWEAVWKATGGALKAVLEENVAEEFVVWRAHADPGAVYEYAVRLDILLIPFDDARYPPLLKEIYDPPILLFARGTMQEGSDPFPLAVVGTRGMTPYGKRVVHEVVPTLARAGITLVSGLALGIDGEVARATIDAGGRTAAVLGSGVDDASIYPSHHRFLADEIRANGGVLLSEFPPGTQPYKSNFPFRNRIISGMSLGVLVVEAGENSGSLITARCALEQNREVFAVPGDLFRQTAQGPNNLAKMGAKIVTNAEDVLTALNLEDAHAIREAREILPDTPHEAALLPHLGSEPATVDALIRASGLDAAAVTSTLTLMEMKGKVRHMGGMMYVKSK